MEIYAIFNYPDNGLPAHQEQAAKLLTEGNKYPVAECTVGDFSSYVSLELDGRRSGFLNSVLFDFVDGDGAKFDIYSFPEFRAQY